MISADRYSKDIYRRCGQSGLMLPALALGLWHNFGDSSSYEKGRDMVLTAFNHGITHFDIANNYGPPPGTAEMFFGRLLKNELLGYRDELIITTKAGYTGWAGPYGDFGSRKYLIASLDRSLVRLGLNYVDIFYHHRRDPDTPLEETMGALADVVKQGKALYVGISNYDPADTRKAAQLLKSYGVKLTINQPRYSMLWREPEEGLFELLAKEGIGSAVFSPLAQGLLTNRYFDGIAADSRAAEERFLKGSDITPELLAKVKALNTIATKRQQTLAQMATVWCLRPKAATSVIIGASRKEQIIENVQALDNIDFTAEELAAIDKILEG